MSYVNVSVFVAGYADLFVHLYSTTVLDPLTRFNDYFPEINECKHSGFFSSPLLPFNHCLTIAAISYRLRPTPF